MKKLITIILILCSVLVFGQAKQVINVGTSANAGNGDKLRTAFQKTNTNFTTLFNNAVMDSTFTSNGLISRTGYGTYSIVTNNSAAWNATATDTVTLSTAITQLPWVVFPQYTTTQRNALTGMPTGAIIDNLTTGRLNRFDGEYWIEQ